MKNNSTIKSFILLLKNVSDLQPSPASSQFGPSSRTITFLSANFSFYRNDRPFSAPAHFDAHHPMARQIGVELCRIADEIEAQFIEDEGMHVGIRNCPTLLQGVP